MVVFKDYHDTTYVYIQFRVHLFFKISFRWSLWEGHLKENYVGNLQWWPLYHAFYDYVFFLSGIYILVLKAFSLRNGLSLRTLMCLSEIFKQVIRLCRRCL